MKKVGVIVLGIMLLCLSACGNEKDDAQSDPIQSTKEADAVLSDDIVPYGEYHLVSAVTEGAGVQIFTSLSDSGAGEYELAEDEILVEGKDGIATEVFREAGTYLLDYEEHEYWTAPKYIAFYGTGDKIVFKGSMMIYQLPLLYEKLPDIMTMTSGELYDGLYREIIENAIDTKLSDIIAENGADYSFDGIHTSAENAGFNGRADAYFLNAGFGEIGVRGLHVSYNVE